MNFAQAKRIPIESIPVIDIAELIDGETKARERVAEGMAIAANEVELTVGVLGAQGPTAVVLIARGVALLIDVRGDADRESLARGGAERQVRTLEFETVCRAVALYPAVLVVRVEDPLKLEGKGGCGRGRWGGRLCVGSRSGGVGSSAGRVLSEEV